MTKALDIAKNLGLTAILATSLIACQNPAQTEIAANQSIEGEAQGIIGGQLLPPTSPMARHIVGLYAIDKQSLCTGTLIADGIVLTAAHCIGSKMAVIFGGDLRASGQNKDMVRPVTAVTVHPRWNGNLRPEGNAGDIAVLKFKGPAPAGWVPAQFIRSNGALQKDVIIQQAGYGASEPLSQDSGSGVLRHTFTTIVNPLHTTTEVTVNQRLGRGVCFGDSGGPSFIVINGQYYIWGVASAVSSPTRELVCRDLGIYTKVLSYFDWIREQSRLLALR